MGGAVLKERFYQLFTDLIFLEVLSYLCQLKL